MRLICPNCDAEYEVDDAAIPREGRDVQCSACGHAWFQEHPEVEAEREAEADLYEAPEGAVAPESQGQVPGTEAAAAPVDAPVDAPAETPGPQAVAEVEDDEPEDVAPAAAAEASPAAAEPVASRPRSLDEAVLAVLREEAEREQAARRAEAAPQPRLESQTEMPLSQASQPGGMPAAVRRIAQLRGLSQAAAPAPEAPAPAATEAPEAGSADATLPARTRSHVFPAIEEINSTLRATSDRVQDGADAVADTMPEAVARRSGFRRGFVLLVSLSVIVVALYVLAPVVAARVPALEGVARAYVAAVDAARIWLDGSLRGLVTMLKGLAGDQQG